MKKIFAYSLTAVLLGAGIMLFPLQIFYVSHGEAGPLTGSVPYVKSLDQSESYMTLREMYGYSDTGILSIEPTDPFVGILAISFFVALVFYLLFKRRRPDSSYRYSQYLRRF